MDLFNFLFNFIFIAFLLFKAFDYEITEKYLKY